MTGMREVLAEFVEQLSPSKAFPGCDSLMGGDPSDRAMPCHISIYAGPGQELVQKNYKADELRPKQLVYCIKLSPLSSSCALVLELALMEYQHIADISKMTFVSPTFTDSGCKYICRINLEVLLKAAEMLALLASVGVSEDLQHHHVMQNSLLAVLGAIDGTFAQFKTRLLSAHAVHIASALFMATSDEEYARIKRLAHSEDGELDEALDFDKPLSEVLSFQREHLQAAKLKVHSATQSGMFGSGCGLLIEDSHVKSADDTMEDLSTPDVVKRSFD